MIFFIMTYYNDIVILTYYNDIYYNDIVIYTINIGLTSFK